MRPGRLFLFTDPSVRAQKPNSLALQGIRRELSLCTGRLFLFTGPSVRAQKPNSLALWGIRRELSLCTGRLFLFPGPSVRAQKPNSLALRGIRRELSLCTSRLFPFSRPLGSRSKTEFTGFTGSQARTEMPAQKKGSDARGRASGLEHRFTSSQFQKERIDDERPFSLHSPSILIITLFHYSHYSARSFRWIFRNSKITAADRSALVRSNRS